MTAALILFTTSFAFANPIEERAEEIMKSAEVSCAKEAAKEIKRIFKNEVKAARAACADLRNCKKAARGNKKQCKNGCKGLKGKEKRQCKKACRQDKRAGFRSCREAYKTPACKGARLKMIKGIGKGIIGLAKNPACRKAMENLQSLK